MYECLSLILNFRNIEAHRSRCTFIIANQSSIQNANDFNRLLHFFLAPPWILSCCSFVSDHWIFFMRLIRPARIGWREKNAKQNLPFMRIRLSFSNIYVKFCIYVIIIEINHHFFFALFFLGSYWWGMELFTTVGLPKNDSSLHCVPLLLLSFFIAPSTLVSAKPFSTQRNFLKAY